MAGLRRSPILLRMQKPYRLIGGILHQQNRDLVLNLCQYGMGNVWEWGKEVGGHSWRTAGDLGGSFYGIPGALFRDGFDVYARNELHKYGGPGGWNDPDYLLLGYLSNWKGQTAPTPLTPNEQYTHVSLWCLVAAPLIFSGDITRLDDFTLSLLTNDEVIDVDQDPLGKPGRRVAIDGDLEVWARDMEDGTKAVGLFNRGEDTATVTAKWTDLGLKGNRSCATCGGSRTSALTTASSRRLCRGMASCWFACGRRGDPASWTRCCGRRSSGLSLLARDWQCLAKHYVRTPRGDGRIWVFGQVHRGPAVEGGPSRPHAHEFHAARQPVRRVRSRHGPSTLRSSQACRVVARRCGLLQHVLGPLQLR